MPIAPMRMPLRTSQDVPRFLGTANDLPHYIAEVEALCQSRHQPADSDMIKYAVYYTDKLSWDAFAAAQDTLEGLEAWQDFKTAVYKVYLQHKVAHTSVSLPASLLPIPVPTASLPSLLPTASIMPLLLQLPVPTKPLLASALSPTPVPAVPQPAYSPCATPILPVSGPLAAPILPAPLPMHKPVADVPMQQAYAHLTDALSLRHAPPVAAVAPASVQLIPIASLLPSPTPIKHPLPPIHVPLL